MRHRLRLVAFALLTAAALSVTACTDLVGPHGTCTQGDSSGTCPGGG